MMRSLVVGLGVQGKKRAAIAGSELVATVDPFNPDAKFKNLKDVDPSTYDAVLMCTPDESKIELMRYCLEHGKHVLVEKPLIADDEAPLKELKRQAEAKKVTLYTAYNHRFEPHFVNIRKVIQSGRLGEIYRLNMFYGNGTARDVRNSAWRDAGTGVLKDIGSHLLDTILFFFDDRNLQFEPVRYHTYENKAYDYVAFATPAGAKNPTISLETTLLSWRNTFRLDIFAEKGTAHVDCLCKWGPSTFTVRERVLPSGRPKEEVEVLEMKDPTWQIEYDYFKDLVRRGGHNVDNDIWILNQLRRLENKNK